MLRRILYSLAVAALPLATIAVPGGQAALAQDTTAVITPSSGLPGSQVTGSGTGWPAGDQVQAYWGADNSALGNPVVVASDGTFSDPFAIPADAAAGAQQVLFEDLNGNLTFFITGDFNVTTGSPTPTVSSPSPVSSPPSVSTPTVVSSPPVVSTPPSVSPLPPTSHCPATLLLGLHGMNEGPSNTMTAVSPTVAETITAFKADTAQLGDGVKETAFPYATVTIREFQTLNGIENAARTVDDTAINLLTDLQVFHKACRSMRILLTGYSMGAWIINDMLADMLAKPGDWSNIKAIELYGDPCWYNDSGTHKGLAREGIPDTCMSSSTYPYPAPANAVPFKVQSLCYGKDPVCGQGLGSINDQLKLARKYCNYTPSPSNTGACMHFGYEASGPGKGATAQGAKFLAQYASGGGSAPALGWAGTTFCAANHVRYMGTLFDGVAACGDAYNGTSSNNQGPISYNGVLLDSDGFQCVELVARYFYYVTGYHPPGGNAKTYASMVHSAYPQSGVSPSGVDSYDSTLGRGDIISMWSSSDQVGHVAVVVRVSLNAAHTGTIKVIDENANPSGTDFITVKNGTMSWDGLNEFQWVYGLP